MNKVSPFGYDPSSSAAPPPPKSAWEYVDQGAGQPGYYWNRQTNETTYDMPYELQEGYESAPPAPPPPPARHALPGIGGGFRQPQLEQEERQDSSGQIVDAAAAGWQLVELSQEEGGNYFWNSITQESTYETPAGWTGASAVGYSDSVADWPEQWERCWDEGSQCEYYRNVVTGSTQWERPASLAVDSYGQEQAGLETASQVQLENQSVNEETNSEQAPIAPPQHVPPPPPPRPPA